ncbi:hypothetical protein [Limnoraphis robusta]|uniref:Uncharacterized protein n=1 Tax=Limnoraphis robusta CCNP1315 TaxID=3110306 RepID=A0ABU5U6Y5_9CYAN|nr:hypothetical protein [Limnoraphis robusta]MEA5499226.1 hypothetical protein [Limnoraphis robusta BA-68 BA1]MEA5522983.1 hypothetical protein [Limnoraphis robusta CCNP1315]MEA5545025.1 hypothetical protein [Limnoraphis robusta CCNP1324]
MVNTLQEGDNGLVRVNYSDLFTKILQLLQNQQTKNPFSLSQDNNRLLIDLDEIAFQVASTTVENPLGGSGSSAKSATVNLSRGFKSHFISQVQQIRDGLKQHIESLLTTGSEAIDLEKFIENLATDINQFKSKSNQINFRYNFEKKYDNLQKQRLSLQSKTASSDPLLKFHKLTITIENTGKFDEQLQASLKNFIGLSFSPDQQEDLNYILEYLVEDLKSHTSDLYRLRRLMDTEALGKVQREAKIKYLEFLKEHLGNHKDIIYLEDFIRRLRLIEDYINDIDKVDGYYDVNYAGISLNYRTIFSESNAFDELPIIPLIVGYLGETKDEHQGRQQFIFGLKLKLGGKVQARGGKPVIDYNLNLLYPNSKEHQEELQSPFKKEFFVKKVLRLTLLYYFVFATIDPSTEGYTPESDLEYDPRKTFEEKVLPILQGSDENKKKSILRGIKRGVETYQASNKIEKLKTMLLTILERKSILQPRSYPIHISLKKGILEEDFSTISKDSNFFQSVLRENPKAALKYISVDSANVNTTSLCTLTANIQISEIHYFSTNESQSFSMEYDLSEVYTIPVLLVPQEDQCRGIYKKSFDKQKLLVFNYNHERLRKEIFHNLESHQAFVYQVTFALLAYISLKILLDASKRRLFIPILRWHLNDKQEPSPEEKFFRSMFAVLSHLLNEKHHFNSQGLYIKDIKPYKVSNALSSLYSVLPKIFRLSQSSTKPTLDKLAIIVVSSRECDRAKSSDYKIANLMGEMIEVQRQDDGSIRLYMIGTFSDNYNSQEIHSRPDILIDEFDRLYQQGFRQVLYIAKSPYSTTLKMTKTEEDEELYFMKKAVLRHLKGQREDMKIYPIFYDKYYAVKLQNLTASSLYIQDVAELETLVKDPSKQAVVFFNLFNGIQVGNEKNYNGVISYATLLNLYEGVLDDQDIREGLIYDTPLKNEILQMLTLYHFSRYEAGSTKINLKLDPHENLIGDDSVGALSIFKHMTGGVKFNSLAFLTEVRKALNVQPESEET